MRRKSVDYDQKRHAFMELFESHKNIRKGLHELRCNLFIIEENLLHFHDELSEEPQNIMTNILTFIRFRNSKRKFSSELIDVIHFTYRYEDIIDHIKVVSVLEYILLKIEEVNLFLKHHIDKINLKMKLRIKPLLSFIKDFVSDITEKVRVTVGGHSS